MRSVCAIAKCNTILVPWFHSTLSSMGQVIFPLYAEVRHKYKELGEARPFVVESGVFPIQPAAARVVSREPQRGLPVGGAAGAGVSLLGKYAGWPDVPQLRDVTYFQWLSLYSWTVDPQRLHLYTAARVLGEVHGRDATRGLEPGRDDTAPPVPRLGGRDEDGGRRYGR